MASYPTLKVVKSLLQKHELAPRKRLGQNFLIEANIARKSLELARATEGNTIVEIGPGLGALTLLLLEKGCRVYTIEKDKGLHHYLESELVSQYPEHLHSVHGDAMNEPLATLKNPPTSFKIVANLPYAISTPWLDEVLSGPLPSRMVLMLQKEAANRFTADPGSGNFGPISLFLRSAYEIDTVHSVSAQCFYPKPDVGSALLSIKRREKPILLPKEAKENIRTIFRQRRKQIGSIVARMQNPKLDQWLEKLIAEDLSRDTRPEAITIEQWQQLALE